MHMNRITTSLRRVCTALMLGLSFPAAHVHAQSVALRIDAPKGIDYNAENYGDLMQEIGKLQITFSSSDEFQHVSNYAKRTLDLHAEYQRSNQESGANRIRYCSDEIKAFPYGENGLCWGNANITQFRVKTLQQRLGLKSDAPIYYRVYSPHFNRMIVGKITPSDEEKVSIHHDEWAGLHRVAFLPPVDREGNAVEAYFAPDLRIGACESSRLCNMYELRTEQPFAVYAQTGDTLRYLMAPLADNLALHADSLVVADTTTCVTTDYRKATPCYFYITDTKGNLCPTECQLSSVYYPKEPLVKDVSEYGYFHGYGYYSVAGTNRFTMTAADGARGAYALPGTQTFQFQGSIVQTTDPDFLMPFNAQGGWTLKRVTIPASTEAVKFSLGESTPLHIVTTLADAAPYADHLHLGAVSYVSRPYAWGENVRMNVESREVSRQIQGNDLIITTLVEGSTAKPSLKLTANYDEQSDTIARGINAECRISDHALRSKERHFTQADFALDGKDDWQLSFSTLHPVKFVIPCHLMQEGYQLVSDFPLDFAATHHRGCAKPIAVGSESPIPYDTITVLLPEEEEFKYRWYMQQGKDTPADDHKYSFQLGATGPFEQHLPDNHFSMLRVTNLGVDSVYIYNDVPESKAFKFSERNDKRQLYYAAEAIPLHAGYNEHTIKYREIKLEKDTFNSVYYWMESPCTYRDEEGHDHPSYTSFQKGSNYWQLNRKETQTPDNAINLSTGSRANLAVTAGSSFAPAYFMEIAPSDADTLVSIYNKKVVRSQFTFNGDSVIPDFIWLNMCFNNQQTHVAPMTNRFRKLGLSDLLPGHYTMEGVAFEEKVDAETGELLQTILTPVKVAFDVPSADAIELNPSVPDAIAPITTEGKGTPQVQARYTIDGRRIATPQPGVNILKMSDGTVRKVVVK